MRPPGFQVAEREFPKRCNVCGSVYNPLDWRELRLIGDQPMPDTRGRLGTEILELRDCPCGNTLCLHLVQEEETDAGAGPVKAEPIPFASPEEGGAWVTIGKDEAVWLQASTGLPTAWKGVPDPYNPQRHELLLCQALGASVRILWHEGTWTKLGNVKIVPIRFV